MGDHTETVAIDYNPDVVSYQQLLNMFWKNHEIHTSRSRQYMSAIFYHDATQKSLAEKSKEILQKEYFRKIQTKILPAETFYDAENYHQKYILRNHGSLLKSLPITESEITTSHLATRLNGYVAGKGTLDAFEQEKDSLGLTAQQMEYIKNIM